MDINTDNIRKLASLDDKDFSSAIYIIATALGFSPEKAKQASSNTAFFRAMLANSSEKDLRNIMNRVGRDKLEDIYGKLPGNR